MKWAELKTFAFLFLLVSLGIAAATASFWLPCGWYAWEAQKNIPGRCIKDFQGVPR